MTNVDILPASKRAALVLTVAVPSLVLLPLHVALFGAVTALVHALFGCLFAVAALDVLFLRFRKVPFACTYLPLGDPRLLWSGKGRDLVACALPIRVRRTGRVEVAGRDRGVRRGTGGNRSDNQEIINRAQRRERQQLDFGTSARRRPRNGWECSSAWLSTE